MVMHTSNYRHLFKPASKVTKQSVISKVTVLIKESRNVRLGQLQFVQCVE